MAALDDAIAVWNATDGHTSGVWSAAVGGQDITWRNVDWTDAGVASYFTVTVNTADAEAPDNAIWDPDGAGNAANFTVAVCASWAGAPAVGDEYGRVIQHGADGVIGWNLFHNGLSNPHLQFEVHDGTSSVTAQLANAITTDQTIHAVAGIIDGGSVYMRTATDGANYKTAGPQTVPSATVINSGDIVGIGRDDGGTWNHAPTGTRIYGIAVWNRAITQSELEGLVAEFTQQSVAGADLTTSWSIDHDPPTWGGAGSDAVLDWDDITDADSYQIERRQPEEAFVLVHTVTGPNPVSTWTDTTTAASTTYEYRVRALDANGVPGLWSDIQTVTTGVGGSALNINNVTQTTADLDWSGATDAGSGVVSYQIQVRKSVTTTAGGQEYAGEATLPNADWFVTQPPNGSGGIADAEAERGGEVYESDRYDALYSGNISTSELMVYDPAKLYRVASRHKRSANVSGANDYYHGFWVYDNVPAQIGQNWYPVAYGVGNDNWQTSVAFVSGTGTRSASGSNLYTDPDNPAIADTGTVYVRTAILLSYNDTTVDNKHRLDWATVEEVDLYNQSGTTLNLTGLDPSTKYWIEVNAIDAAGNKTHLGPTDNFTTTAATTAGNDLATSWYRPGTNLAIVIDEPTPGTYGPGNLPTFSGTATGDNLTHVKAYVKDETTLDYWTGSAWSSSWSWYDATGTTSWTAAIPTTFPSDGNYTFVAWPGDNSTGTTYYGDYQSVSITYSSDVGVDLATSFDRIGTDFSVNRTSPVTYNADVFYGDPQTTWHSGTVTQTGPLPVYDTLMILHNFTADEWFSLGTATHYLFDGDDSLQDVLGWTHGSTPNVFDFRMLIKPTSMASLSSLLNAGSMASTSMFFKLNTNGTLNLGLWRTGNVLSQATSSVGITNNVKIWVRAVINCSSDTVDFYTSNYIATYDADHVDHTWVALGTQQTTGNTDASYNAGAKTLHIGASGAAPLTQGFTGAKYAGAIIEDGTPVHEWDAETNTVGWATNQGNPLNVHDAWEATLQGAAEANSPTAFDWSAPLIMPERATLVHGDTYRVQTTTRFKGSDGAAIIYAHTDVAFFVWQDTAGSDLGTSWYIESDQGDDLPTSWYIESDQGDDAATSWYIESNQGDDAATSWYIESNQGDDAATSWEIQAGVGDSYTTSWYLESLQGDDLPTSWNVTDDVGDDLPTSWYIESLANNDVATSWDIQSNPNDDLATSWEIQSAPGDDLTTSWNITVDVSDDLPTSWEIQSSGIGNDLATSWIVQFYHGADFSTIWDIVAETTDPGDTPSLGVILADWQFAYRDLVLGPGTSIEIVRVDGLVGYPAVRRGDVALPRRDGFAPGFHYLNQKKITFKIEAYGPPESQELADLEDMIADNFQIAREVDYPLQFKRPGFAQKQVLARPTRVSRPMHHTQERGMAQWDIELTASDPRTYGVVLHQANIPLYDASAASGIDYNIVDFAKNFPATFNLTTVVNNAGNTDAYPIVRFDGPITGTVTGVLITNETNGQILDVDATITTGQILTVDMPALVKGTAATIVSLDGATRYNDWQLPREEFGLTPGDNVLRFEVDGTSTDAKCSLSWFDTWK